ncbi:MAG: B12-binding domain-containing radical SAM protein [Candidatus Helarchaeota archaeon]
MKNLDVLLIHPSTLLDKKKANKSIMSNILVGYGLLSIGTVLKKNGFEVEVWNIPDLYYKGFSKENIISIFKHYDPLIIGIELNWIHFSKGAFEWAELLKETFPNSKIAIGGVHQNIILKMLGNNRKYFLKLRKYIDIFFIGESEKSFLNYTIALKKNSDASKIRGTIIFKDDKIINNGSPEIFDNLDDIPPYNLNILRPKLSPPYNLAMINTCRGPCKFSCIYCIGNRRTYSKTGISPRKKLAFHSIKWIIAQIQYLIRELKPISLSIQDYIYSEPKLINELALELRKYPEVLEKIKSFNIASIPGTLNNEILNNLAKAKVDSIDIGVESGSSKVLKILRRPYNLTMVKDTVKSCSKSGIIPKTYWMVGLPQESIDDVNLTEKLMIETIKLGGIPRWVTPVCIFPTLEMYDDAQKYDIVPRFSSFKDYFIFSEAQRNSKHFYPEVITHKTNFMSYEDIILASNKLKEFIINKKDIILKFQQKNLKNYVFHHPELGMNSLQLKIDSAINNVAESFF